MEKGMVTHSSIVAWEIPWTEEPDMTEQLTLSLMFTFNGILMNFEIYIIKYYTKFNYESGFTFLLQLS